MKTIVYAGGKDSTLCQFYRQRANGFRLFGGQGTINVHSWSPDNRTIAFVSYRLKQ